MAENIKISIDVDDGGSTKNRVKDANSLAKAYDNVATSVNAVKAAMAPKTTGAIKGATQSPMESIEYGQARASVGTGAAGRDFAKQAQGLGGLVHLYATYAANLFAAGAAFRALSNAADTSNMVQGMNQLGAASGLALGSIAKKLMEATDGAISMREAMEATTKGTTAGLNAKQMEQLGQVANKASKALGIGMPDAISRLTRGISKLEPELLDELGLFTKIGPATENYARSIGKTTAQLTDFERRQAFANAVLKEGTDKFNSIDIPANPYDKLLASLKNLSFVALDLSNKVLVPLVNLLSQNPVALLAVLTGIGATIIKSAIPALGHYRENLKQTAESSRQAFAQMYSNQQEAFGNLAADQGASAERAFRNNKEIKSKLETLQKEGSSFTKGKKIDYAAIASKDAFSLTDTELKSLDNRVKYLARKNAEEADRLKKHVENLKAIRQQSSNIGDVASSKTIEGSEKWWSTAFANDRINKQKLGELATQTIRSNVAETQSLLGMRAAWVKLTQDVDAAQKGFLKVQTGIDASGNAITTTAPKMSKLDGYIVKSVASAGMLVQKLGTTISAFGIIGMSIGAAVATFGILDSIVTKTGKETALFNSALDSTTEAVANVDRTIAALRKQPGIATASIQGFLALANSSQTVTDSIETQIQATKDLLKVISDSKWDSFTNSFAGLFNQDVASKSAKSLATTVESQLKVFREAGMGDEASAAFKLAIGVQSLDLETLTDRFKTSTSAQEEFSKSNKLLTNRLGENSSKLQEFKTSTEALNKAYDEFIQSTANTNPLFKVGEALQNLSASMMSVVTQGIEPINAAFNQLASNPKSIAQFGPEFVQQFVNIRKEFQTTLAEASKFKQEILKINDEIDKNKKALENAKENFFFEGRFTAEKSNAESNLDKLETEKKKIQELQIKLDTKSFLQASQLFKIGAEGAFKNSADYIEKALGEASKKAALTIAQATVSALSGEEAARRSGQLKDREIQLQIDQIDTTIGLIRSNTDLETTIAEMNARMTLADAKTSGKSPEVIALLQAQADAMGVFKGILVNSKGRIKPADIPDADNPQTPFIKKLVGEYNSKVGTQEASRILKDAEKKANSLDTQQKISLGRLANEKQLAAINESILQQDIARQDILMNINSLGASENLVKKQQLETQIQQSKFASEIAGYEVAIKNAKLDTSPEGKKEVGKQEELLKKVKDRQDQEKDNKGVENRIKLKAQELQQSIALNALNDAILDQDITRLGIVSSLVGFTSEQNVLETTRLENQKLENKFALERKKIEDDIESLKKDSTASTKSIALAEANLILVKDRQEKEKDNKGLQDAVKLLESRYDLEQKLAGFRKTAADAQGQQAEDELNYKKELGLVTSEEYAKEKAQLDRSRVGRETAVEQANIDILIKKKKLAEETIAIIETSGDMATPAAFQNILELTNLIDAQSESLKAVNDQKLNAIDLNEKLADRMVGFSSIVKDSFLSMADAMVEFAKTGKFSFNDLIVNMLAGLLRFELQFQLSSMYKGFGGLAGILNAVGFSFGGPEQLSGPGMKAKGAAYDSGIQKFAMGGAFTNSIVSSPTLFKFAKGAGMMGEAGPEAIMPLKRDNNGNLGVRTNGGGQTSVVVNNYSNAQATTKETTDSRGNRKIEVIVGDLVAQEVARPGSAMQQTMGSTFGQRPMVPRR